MNELVKTSIFVGIATLFTIGAIASRPVLAPSNPQDEVGKPLFPEFTNPDQAANLSITKYDSEIVTLNTLTLEDSPTGWIVTSEGGYPADASEQVRAAATALIDLKVIDAFDALPSQLAEFGLVKPDVETLDITDSGVGELVVIADSSKKPLAELIIGKQDASQPAIRYVRIPSRDRIYVVELNPEAFPIEFKKWIDSDLLELNPFDVTQMTFGDYSAALLQGNGSARIDRADRMEAVVDYSDIDNKWTLSSFQLPQNGRLAPAELGPGEKLNENALTAVRTALDELQLVDVVKKPAGLAENLKVEGQFNNEGLDTLILNGFLPYGTKPMKLIGDSGEISIHTRDAVKYRLLFGKEQDGGADGTRRFLMIQVELDRAALGAPEMTAVPELKEGDGVDVKKLAEEIAAIKLANDRALDAYREKENAAMRKVFEMNSRFADWYYVIPNEQYQKIMLSKERLIESPAGAAAGPKPNQSGVPLMLQGLPGAAKPPVTQPPVQSMQPATKPAAEEAKPADAGKPADTPEKPAEEKPKSEEAPKSETPAEEKPAADAPKAEAPSAEKPAEPATETPAPEESK
ncbi:DUF4340 domain-containing protein [Blastopirellula sp. JC732]|uniref:DUF4340 domain-containing protein n=1 Tax=Blastopirellula sediminis TaxID=2894196 RepID=A0A9X1SIJ7_9BACT|nr:DUF4340 domain-containing protein [Blastopirellula sediminis]MCC9605007.1 DUF4340 domain-containing protein [Blastopirellula sediminis]MCC9631693.1 DUF4340 domain-containing protein [Blastopirellula sediminis]